MRRQNGFSTIVVLISIALVVVAAGGTYLVIANGQDSSGNDVEEVVAQANQDQIDESEADSSELLNNGEYPALYKQYDLPEYPGAIIEYDGRTDDNLRDGISLKITTPDDVQTVGEFYENAFSSLSGWTYTPPNYSNDTLYGATAEKADENLRYQLTVTKLPDNTQINISFLEI